MEDRPIISEYQGTPPIKAGIDTFFGSTLTNVATASILISGWNKVFNKTPFFENIKGYATSKIMWCVSGTFALYNAFEAYREAKKAVQQHQDLVIENAVLHDRLQHTGEVLTQVADKIEETNKPRTSHVERIAAEKTEAAPALG